MFGGTLNPTLPTYLISYMLGWSLLFCLLLPVSGNIYIRVENQYFLSIRNEKENTDFQHKYIYGPHGWCNINLPTNFLIIQSVYGAFQGHDLDLWPQWHRQLCMLNGTCTPNLNCNFLCLPFLSYNAGHTHNHTSGMQVTTWPSMGGLQIIKDFQNKHHN